MSSQNDGVIEVESYIVVPQRRAICPTCSSKYIGKAEEVKCRGCGRELKTVDMRATLKVPTATWTLPRGRRKRG